MENTTVTQEMKKLFQQYPELAGPPPPQQKYTASGDEDLYGDDSNLVPVDTQLGPPTEGPYTSDSNKMPPKEGEGLDTLHHCTHHHQPNSAADQYTEILSDDNSHMLFELKFQNQHLFQTQNKQSQKHEQEVQWPLLIWLQVCRHY